MSDLFLDLFNRSVSASWVVLAVVLARLLLKKAPKSIHCLLWALVGLRLVCFWDLHAVFSLIPSSEIITPESLFDRAPVITSGVPLIDNVVNPVYTESFRTDGLSSVNPLQVWVAVWANIWLLVMVGFWIWSLVSWIRVKMQVRAAVKLQDNIFHCDAIDTPFILGMITPKIYLPSALSDKQTAHVIAHERAHLKRLDHWWKPLAWLLLTIHWFNPLLWLAYILLCRDIELACDERVIGDMSVEGKKSYSAALLSCSVHRSMIAACPLAFGEVGVKARVKSVLSYKKPAFWVILAALVVVAVLAAGFLTDPPGAPAEVRWRDTLYVQAGKADFLPDKIESQGMLTSVLHDSTPHPTRDGQAIGLGWEYAGQPFYQVGNTLYLEEPGGEGYLTFRAMDASAVLTDLQTGGCTEEVTVYLPNSIISEELTGNRELKFTLLLDDLRHMELTPGGIVDAPTGVIKLKRNGETIAQLKQSGGEWSLEAAGSQWRFQFPDLSDFLAQWEQEAKPFENLEGISQLRVHALSRSGITLRFTLPDDRFDYELENRDLTFRLRETGKTGWITVRYDPEGDSSKSRISVTAGAFTLETDTKNTWADQNQPLIDAILGSITLSRDGVSILGPANALGISMDVSQVTPDGLYLTIIQNGIPVREITTGRMFMLERYEDGSWVSVLPRETLWTTEAYVLHHNGTLPQNIDWSQIAGRLPAGHYRIGKYFTGTAPNPGVPVYDPEPIELTVYAEFDIP